MNDPVRLQMGKEWIPATIVSSEVAPRSYKVKTDQGSILRRNRRVINPVPTEKRKNPDMNNEYDYQYLEEGDTGTISEKEGSPSKVDSSETVSQESADIHRSRSGRAVVKPKWLKDYVE